MSGNCNTLTCRNICFTRQRILNRKEDILLKLNRLKKNSWLLNFSLFIVIYLFEIAKRINYSNITSARARVCVNIYFYFYFYVTVLSLLEPEFAEPIPNVTIPVGRDVSLPCVVSNLGNYKVFESYLQLIFGFYMFCAWFTFHLTW